jgi:hypothetical protein
MREQKPARFALYDDVPLNRETVTIVSVFTVVPHGPWVYVVRRKNGAGYVCEIHPEEALALSNGDRK